MTHKIFVNNWSRTVTYKHSANCGTLFGKFVMEKHPLNLTDELKLKPKDVVTLYNSDGDSFGDGAYRYKCF